MSLPHALLTSLVERPSAGSDLARRFEATIAYYWPASHQQIYRELGRMEEAGWVECAPDGQHGRRKVYACLPAGEAELRRWLEEGGEAPVIRDPLLVRLRAEAQLGTDVLRTQVAHRLAEHESRLTAYEVIARRDFGGELDHAGRIREAILRAGISYERHSRDWCRETLTMLDAAGGADHDRAPDGDA